MTAVPTSHDSPGSVCYRVDTPDGKSVGICTDLGYVSPMILDLMSGCDHLLLESNYDEEMLKNGPYPYYLKNGSPPAPDTCPTASVLKRSAA